MVLCHFLETNREKYNLADRNVIELGAGTGLVTIVSSLLGTKTKQPGGYLRLFEIITCSCLFHSPGAKVTSTDLPDVLGNLRYNVMRNTKGHCKYIPEVGLQL